MSDPKRMTFGEFDGHLKTTNEILNYFKDNEEVVWNINQSIKEFKQKN